MHLGYSKKYDLLCIATVDQKSISSPIMKLLKLKISTNRHTSLIASATQHLIRSSYRSADRWISGASGQCSNINNAYSQHLALKVNNRDWKEEIWKTQEAQREREGEGGYMGGQLFVLYKTKRENFTGMFMLHGEAEVP